jgi:hypothetical protein
LSKREREERREKREERREKREFLKFFGGKHVLRRLIAILFSLKKDFNFIDKKCN